VIGLHRQTAGSSSKNPSDETDTGVAFMTACDEISTVGVAVRTSYGQAKQPIRRPSDLWLGLRCQPNRVKAFARSQAVRVQMSEMEAKLSCTATRGVVIDFYPLKFPAHGRVTLGFVTPSGAEDEG
jgi:hypothetical protein